MQQSRYFLSPLVWGLIIISWYASIQAQHPYHSSWSKDGWIIGAGTAVAISALAVNFSITPLTEQEIERLSRESVNAFDRPATYNYSKTLAGMSDVLVSLNAAAAMLLLFDQNIRNDWQTLSIMSMETALLTTFIPMCVKGQVQRIRPFAYNSNVPLDGKTTREVKRSFFSGHTSAAFAASVFISTVYSDYFPHSKWKPFVWTGSLLLASTVGFLRYESGAHFPTDIITGAVVGSIIGYMIPRLHRQNDHRVSITPLAYRGNMGLSFCIQF